MSRDERWRPRFHYTPARHWINDPNGLVRLDGEYHLYYQHNPQGDRWGHMSWGHAVGRDLVDWHELPVAIPETERVSIYSGSVVVDAANTSGFGAPGQAPLVAVYTGCRRRPEGGQAQELAYSVDRGRRWTPYAGNPVLDLGLRDFRDPKVFWHAETARWIMVVVVPDARRARFYASPDLKAWTLLSDFGAPFEGEGIWECPDLIPFELAGEGRIWMLKVDVFGGHPSGGTGARLFFGRFDGNTFTPEAETAPRWADQGADFYAALSFANLDADEAPVWLAWMNCHRYAQALPTAPWRGAMTLPRRLALRRVEGRIELLQQPVAELERLRGAPVAAAAATIDGAGADLLG
ncbi:MAG: glycoside hydrolase family 32 protein, partial [Burkholderiales bacterium]|nr:glycoside hydrolase family 32 protein [Burkholderiales bacterium]